MDSQTIDAITRLIEAVTNLVTVLGRGWFALIVISVTATIFGIPAWREHLRNKRADIVVENKEKEVERLAADNRRYREVYLARMGVPQEVLALDRQDSIDAATERSGKGDR